jgi:hypothetical protein
MKILPGPTKLIILAAIVSVSICAIITFAAEKAVPKTDDQYSIKLTMGLDGDSEPLHCSRKSLKEALAHNPAAAHKIHFHSTKDGKPDEDFPPAKDIGGASPYPGKDRPSGVHSTQQIAFGDAAELKAFVKTLTPEP